MKNQDDKEDSNGYTPLLNESTLQDDEDELEQVLIQKAEKGTKSLSGITKNPYETAGIFSTIFFTWVYPVIKV